jgi:hypothetical protein
MSVSAPRASSNGWAPCGWVIKIAGGQKKKISFLLPFQGSVPRLAMRGGRPAGGRCVRDAACAPGRQHRHWLGHRHWPEAADFRHDQAVARCRAQCSDWTAWGLNCAQLNRTGRRASSVSSSRRPSSTSARWRGRRLGLVLDVELRGSTRVAAWT